MLRMSTKVGPNESKIKTIIGREFFILFAAKAWVFPGSTLYARYDVISLWYVRKTQFAFPGGQFCKNFANKLLAIVVLQIKCSGLSGLI